MFKTYIPVLLLFLSQAASAQVPELQWAKSFPSHNTSNASVYNNGRAVGVDQQGNVYSTGLFNGTIDMDPGPGVYDIGTNDPDIYGIYISKLDANGNFVWARAIMVRVEFAEIDLKVDKAGNVYVASEFLNPADMDPGPGVKMMYPTGLGDAFVIKLNTDGNLIWVKQFGGPGDTGAESSILEIDRDNNVVLCGTFNNTVDFDPGPGTSNLTSTAHVQAFIVKLNSNGDFIWAKQFGNSPVVYSGSRIADVRCDAQGNIFVTGGFAGSCDFDPGPGVYTLASGSISDGFIAKLTGSGSFVWAKKLGNTSTDYNNYIMPRGIEIDGMNNVITAGYFTGSFDFDPGTAVKSVPTGGGAGSDCYILKLTADGNFVWVKTIGGGDYDTGNDLELDHDDNIYLAGSFGRTVDYDPGPGDHTVTSPYYGPGGIVKLNSNGEFIYAALFESIMDGTNLCRRMVVDDAQNIYTGGFVTGSVDFDPGPGVYQLSVWEETPFVLKLSRCKNITTSTLNITACNDYILNNETFDESGTYTRVIPNTQGCDSVITLHLTLTKQATQQSKVICEGESFFAGGANQTLSGTYKDTLQTVLGCDSIVTTLLTVNPKPSPDLGPDKNLCDNTQLTVTPGSFTSYLWQDMSNSSSYTVTTPGTYWVKVSNGFGCTAIDTLIIQKILSSPSNFLKATDSICTYESLEIQSLDPYAGYQWSTGETGRTLVVQQPGIYWLKVTDAGGCSGTDSITVFGKKCIRNVYIPSAFTPNGDGKNDVFKPVVFGTVKKYHFAVYNRWGAVVFQTSDPQKGWNGMIDGIAQPNAVFVWTCYYQFEGMEPISEKGTVVLVR